MKTVTDPDGGMTTYNYDNNGDRQSVIYPNGTVAEYTYDNLNRLTKLFNRKANGDTISCYEYTLGLAGNRTKVTEHTGRVVDYTYDDTYKLTSEIISDPVFGSKTISYTYDDVGNRLTKTEDGVVTNYVYDDNDRLLDEISNTETTTYSYDANGNTVAKATVSATASETSAYTYDFNNRLISVDDGTDVITYAYDTDDMRVQKTVNSNVTNYLLDKNRDYAQVLKEVDGSGNTIVSYIYGDDLISQNRNSSFSYYHYDGQLSTRQLTDASAQVTDKYTYDAFGLLLNRSGATENNYMYTGEQYDPNVGFYYLRARYYNPTIGRFHTMDTWPGMQFEPMSLHKYLYCGNNPMNYIDPSGQWAQYMTWIATSVAYGILAAAIYGVINKTLLKRDPDWWEYFVVGGIAAISQYLIVSSLIIGSGKLILAAGGYALREAIIDLGHREKVTFGGVIINALTAAVLHGLPLPNIPGPPGDMGYAYYMPNVTKSVSRIPIKMAISKFADGLKNWVNNLAPPSLSEVKDYIVEWADRLEFEMYKLTHPSDDYTKYNWAESND